MGSLGIVALSCHHDGVHKLLCMECLPRPPAGRLGAKASVKCPLRLEPSLLALGSFYVPVNSSLSVSIF
jgi:hypothetical protein